MSTQPSMLPSADPSTGVPAADGTGAATAQAANVFDTPRPDRWTAKDYEQMGLDVEHLELGTPSLDAMRFLLKRALAPLTQQLSAMSSRIQQLEHRSATASTPAAPAAPPQASPATLDYQGYLARMHELVPGFGPLLRTAACLGWRAETDEFQRAMDACDVATSYRLLQAFFQVMRVHKGYEWTADGWQQVAASTPTGMDVPGGALSQTTLRPSMPVIAADGGKPQYTETQVQAVFSKMNKGTATEAERAMCADMNLALQEGRVISG